MKVTEETGELQVRDRGGGLCLDLAGRSDDCKDGLWEQSVVLKVCQLFPGQFSVMWKHGDPVSSVFSMAEMHNHNNGPNLLWDVF